MSRKRANKTRPFVQLDAKLLKNYMPIIGPNGLAVYTCLKLHENRRTGQCNPSYQTVAEETGLSRRSVIRYTAQLIKLKLISPTPLWSKKGNRTSNQYNLTDPNRLDYGERSDNNSPKNSSAIQSLPDFEPEPPSHYPSDTDALQPDSPNQINITKIEKPEIILTDKQRNCTHHPSSVQHFGQGVNICHNCYGLLDDDGQLIEELPTVDEEAA